ncbi:MAG: hypothetical protein ACE5IG_03910 [Dehalococcoidia bacterium]
MIFLKACSRCKGDLYVNRDQYGLYRKCLQCGHIEELPLQAQESQAYAEAPALRRQAA